MITNMFKTVADAYSGYNQVQKNLDITNQLGQGSLTLYPIIRYIQSSVKIPNEFALYGVSFITMLGVLEAISQ